MKETSNMETSKQVCCSCIMDTKQDESLQFDFNGICSDCTRFYKNIEKKWNYGMGHEEELSQLLNRIKKSGKNRKYDCIIGFSGGMDSSYMLHMAVKEWGLRPLVIHIDSGFDLPVGINNVKKIIQKLGVNLHIEKIDENDFRNFQIACFRTGLAGCLDYPQDHAFISIIDEYAAKHKIKYILNGYNTSTEVIRNPKTHSKNCGQGSDLVFIRDVLKKHSPAPLKHYQFTGIIRRKIILPIFKKVHIVQPLDLIPYVKKDILDFLIKEYNYEPYTQKHFESLMTKFIEGYWLPKRFGFDVRIHQLSSLILTKQMTRDEALKIVSQPPITEEEGNEMFLEISKKLKITAQELRSYFDMPLWQNKYKNRNWLYTFGEKFFFKIGKDKRIRK